MSDEQVRYRPGDELTHWPEMKFARAQEHLAALQARMVVWASTSKARIEERISADQHQVDLIVTLPMTFPLAEMSLAIGDAVHNLRSALDAVVWELAHVNGATPKRPTQVAFPICATQEQFDKAVAGPLESVPAAAVERMKSVQPFIHHTPAQTALAQLHAADIRDKHRAQLACIFVIEQIDVEDAVFTFEDEAEIPDPPFEISFQNEGDVKDGESLMSFRSTGRFKSAKVPVSLGAQINVESTGGRILLGSILTVFVQQVRATLDILYYGLDEANSRNRRAEAAAASQAANAAGDMPPMPSVGT